MRSVSDKPNRRFKMNQQDVPGDQQWRGSLQPPNLVPASRQSTVEWRPGSARRAYIVLGWICSSSFSSLPLMCPYSIVAVMIRFKSWAVSAFSSR